MLGILQAKQLLQPHKMKKLASIFLLCLPLLSIAQTFKVGQGIRKEYSGEDTLVVYRIENANTALPGILFVRQSDSAYFSFDGDTLELTSAVLETEDIISVGSFRNLYGAVHFVNDSFIVSGFGAKRFTGLYDLSNIATNQVRQLGFYPNGDLGGSIPQMSMKLGNADTTANLKILEQPNAIGQLFNLESKYKAGTVGFESQVDGSLNTAKMYATNASGSTNLSVIEVDSVSIRIKTDNAATISEFNSNGLVLPPLSSEPTGENGAMYYNTSTNKFRIYENGAWRDM